MSFVLLRRGSEVESRHRVHVAVVDAKGSLVAGTGDPSHLTFLRSAAKPFQAIPLVEEGVVERFGIPPEEMALAIASHSGEAEHVEGVRRLLARCGVPEEALACGPHAPMFGPAAREIVKSGSPPLRVHNNCSGKHAGMLALARHRGWALEGYQTAGHPVQRRMLAEMSRWAGVPAEEIRTGVDGCGVVCFALPLRAAAVAYARLADGARRGSGPEAAIVGAMARHPQLLSGTGRLDRRIIEAAGGRVVVKTGAEGVYGAAVPEAGLGVVLKVEDGATRAAEVAIVEVLRAVGFLPTDAAHELLARIGSVPNTRGEPVADLIPDIDLRRGAAE